MHWLVCIVHTCGNLLDWTANDQTEQCKLCLGNSLMAETAATEEANEMLAATDVAAGAGVVQ